MTKRYYQQYDWELFVDTKRHTGPQSLIFSEVSCLLQAENIEQQLTKLPDHGNGARWTDPASDLESDLDSTDPAADDIVVGVRKTFAHRARALRDQDMDSSY